jgi:hypothetical protein
MAFEEHEIWRERRAREHRTQRQAQRSPQPTEVVAVAFLSNVQSSGTNEFFSIIKERIRARLLTGLLEDLEYRQVIEVQHSLIATVAPASQSAKESLVVLLIHRFRPTECPWLARVGRDVLVVIAKLV